MKYFNRLIILVIPFLLFINTASAEVGTKSLKNAFSNVEKTAKEASYNTNDDKGLLLSNNINNIINIALSMLGVIFVLLAIYGGFLYMTARGQEEQTKKGQSIIVQAIIGLLIVISAYAISYFVFKFFI